MNSPLPQIVLVDDHKLFREGIKLLIEHEHLGKVVGEAENGKKFLKMLNSLNPDIVLMDIEMPLMKGIEATIKAKALRPDLKIIAVTMKDRKNDFFEMVDAGFMGIVLKTSDKNEFVKAINSVHSGEQYYCHEILQSVVSETSQKTTVNLSPSISNSFTSMEYKVLQYLCKGLSSQEIAEKIYRSVKTVEIYRSKLLEKTNSKNTLNLVLYAIKNRLVDFF